MNKALDAIGNFLLAIVGATVAGVIIYFLWKLLLTLIAIGFILVAAEKALRNLA